MINKIACILALLTLHLAASARGPIFTDIPSSGALHTSTVHTFFKDRGQMLWIGTDKEIIAFDGNNTTYTTIFDDNKIPVVTNAFVVSANSDLLAATSNGLYKIDFSNVDSKYHRLFDKKIKAANCLAVTASDSILVGTDKGLMMISPDLVECSQPIATSLKIRAIIPDGAHAFIATDQGVYSINLATKALKLISDPFNAIDLLRSGDRLYAASNNDGLMIINLSSGVSEHIDVSDAVINQLAIDSSDNLYIATDGDGILRLSPDDNSIAPMPINHLKSNEEHNDQIYSLLIDKFDRMFIGYYLMGAEHSLLTSDTFSMMPIPGIQSGASVRAVHTEGDKLMVGTRNGAFYINKSTGQARHITKEELGSGLVLAIEKIDGKYAIGTYGGSLSIFDPQTNTISKFKDKNLRGSIFSFATDKNGYMWMGTSSGIYKTYGNSTMAHIASNADGDSLSNVYTMFFDSSGRGWAATAMGTYNIDCETNKLRLSDRVTDKDVRQIYETRNHDLWFVTNAGHITVYTSDLKKSDLNKVVSTITDARGVVEDAKGRVWITTTNGLFKCSPFDEVLSSYGFADGIPTPMFNSGAPKISEDGILYLCHTGGLLHTNLESTADGVLSRRNAHPSFVTDSNGSRLLPENSTGDTYYVDLPVSQKMIKLSLTDGSYAGSEMSRYEYSIDNGNTWVRVPADMNITFSLTHDEYTNLSIRQIGNPLTETKITVHNPKSYDGLIWTGITLAILLLISAGWLYTIYIYKKKRQNAPAPAPAPEQTPAQPESEEKETTPPTAEVQAAEPENKKYTANYLSEKECMKIAKQAKTLLQETKLYTDPDLKIATIAEKIGVSSHKLSYVFSQYLLTSYYDYIYEFRVEEFKRLAQADKKQAYTLVALSEKAGFNSRATFFRAFKKFEGITPGDYLRQLRNKDSEKAPEKE